jgi:hypothetical protein
VDLDKRLNWKWPFGHPHEANDDQENRHFAVVDTTAIASLRLSTTEE